MRLVLAEKKSNVLTIGVCIALVQIACYYVMSVVVRHDGEFAMAQPDTLLYCQAARRIVEGFPFSFSPGTAASTGTTSVLYPFILAPLYWLGFKGAALLTAGFVLNALFYIAFIVGWSFVVFSVFRERHVSAFFAVVVLALFGPFAYCALAQSDIGLWMAVSAWLAYGLASGKRKIYVPLLILAPWMRPEGMVLVASYSLFYAVDALRRRRFDMDCLVVVVSTISMAGVFVLNYSLTGEFQFASVAQKGYFKNLSFAPAVYASAVDFMRIFKAYFLGLPQNAPRDFFYIPFVSAVLLWTGLSVRSWRNVSWREFAWYAAMLGGVGLVATSGWENTNLDRYLIWIMPVLLIYMVHGADAFSQRMMPCSAKIFPFAVFATFTCAMAFVMVFVFGVACRGADRARDFMARCDAIMPPGASFGSWGSCGLVYGTSGRRAAHVSGIYSPEFLDAHSVSARFEILKNDVKSRFDYWLCEVSDKKSHYCDKPDIVAGPLVFTSPPGLELRKSDWSAYDAALAVPSASREGLSCRARVDVAYESEERSARYEPITRDGYPFFASFHRAGRLNGTNIVEAGRFLLGGDAMSVALEPGKDVHVVMRTALECTAYVEKDFGNGPTDFSLKSPLKIQILVDDVDAGMVDVKVSEGDFCDARFVIPGECITHSKPRLAFIGEHVAFGYWFYQ